MYVLIYFRLATPHAQWGVLAVFSSLFLGVDVDMSFTRAVIYINPEGGG